MLLQIDHQQVRVKVWGKQQISLAQKNNSRCFSKANENNGFFVSSWPQQIDQSANVDRFRNKNDNDNYTPLRRERFNNVALYKI